MSLLEAHVRRYARFLKAAVTAPPDDDARLYVSSADDDTTHGAPRGQSKRAAKRVRELVLHLSDLTSLIFDTERRKPSSIRSRTDASNRKPGRRKLPRRRKRRLMMDRTPLRMLLPHLLRRIGLRQKSAKLTRLSMPLLSIRQMKRC